MTKNLKVVFGIDSDGNLYGGHFGDSNYFQIAEINLNEKRIILTEKILNPYSDDDKGIHNKSDHHGEPEKARNISSLLPNIQIIAAHAMGLNIKKIKKKFHILMFTEKKFSKILQTIEQNISKIGEFADQNEKKIMRLK